MLRLLLLVVFLATNVIHGSSVKAKDLDGCGPYELPVLGNVITIPGNDDAQRVTEVKVVVEMRSNAQLKFQWAYINVTDLSWILPDDGSLRLNQSAKVIGRRYISVMTLKLGNTAQTMTEISRNIFLATNVNYGCNHINLKISVERLLQLVGGNYKLPTFTAMPHLRYIVDDEGVFEIKVGISDAPGRPAAETHCRYDLQRKAGRLVWPRDDDGDYFNAETKVIGSSPGRSETVCKADLRGDREAVYVLFTFDFWINSHSHYDVTIPVEVRQNGLTTPAIRLFPSVYNESVSDVRYIPATEQGTENFWCFADAENRPNVSVERVTDVGRYELSPNPLSVDNSYLSRFGATYTVRVPSASEADEYVCTAKSGKEVTSERFKIISYAKV